MIQPNELRIGNWVKHNNIISSSELPGTVFQWTSAHWYDIETTHLSLSSIDAITLTPEILEKCGFETIGNTPFFSMRISINHSDELAWYSQDNILRY
jgi:hypothetical protein